MEAVSEYVEPGELVKDEKYKIVESDVDASNPSKRQYIGKILQYYGVMNANPAFLVSNSSRGLSEHYINLKGYPGMSLVSFDPQYYKFQSIKMGGRRMRKTRKTRRNRRKTTRNRRKTYGKKR